MILYIIYDRLDAVYFIGVRTGKARTLSRYPERIRCFEDTVEGVSVPPIPRFLEHVQCVFEATNMLQVFEHHRILLIYLCVYIHIVIHTYTYLYIFYYEYIYLYIYIYL